MAGALSSQREACFAMSVVCRRVWAREKLVVPMAYMVQNLFCKWEELYWWVRCSERVGGVDGVRGHWYDGFGARWAFHSIPMRIAAL